MTTFYTLGARLSGMAAVVCAALAVLAYPGQARADPDSECADYCNKAGGIYITCYYQCIQQGGPPSCTTGACDSGCGKLSTPNCSGGGCTAIGKNACTACKCSDPALGSQCECI